MTHPTQELERLRVENAYLKEEIAEMRHRSGVDTLVGKIGLSGQQAQFLLTLTQTPDVVVSKRSVYGSVFSKGDGDGPLDKIMDVVLCRVRQRLKKAGAPGKIDTAWGRGWKADAELSAWTKALVEG